MVITLFVKLRKIPPVPTNGRAEAVLHGISASDGTVVMSIKVGNCVPIASVAAAFIFLFSLGNGFIFAAAYYRPRKTGVFNY
jgi:hypothetical protein